MLEVGVVRAMVRRQILVQRMEAICNAISALHDDATSVGAEVSMAAIRAQMTRIRNDERAMDAPDAAILPEHLTNETANPYTRQGLQLMSHASAVELD